jgi:hypothetical protein
MPADPPLPNGGSMAEDATPQQQRLEPVLCPYCEQVTMPNLLADRSAVCSCPAERSLPQALLGDAPGLTAPMDAVGPSGLRRDAGHPPGSKPRLPDDHGQFGRDVATEAHAPLAPPPAAPR